MGLCGVVENPARICCQAEPPQTAFRAAVQCVPQLICLPAFKHKIVLLLIRRAVLEQISELSQACPQLCREHVIAPHHPPVKNLTQTAQIQHARLQHVKLCLQRVNARFACDVSRRGKVGARKQSDDLLQHSKGALHCHLRCLATCVLHDTMVAWVRSPKRSSNTWCSSNHAQTAIPFALNSFSFLITYASDSNASRRCAHTLLLLPRNASSFSATLRRCRNCFRGSTFGNPRRFETPMSMRQVVVDCARRCR